MSNNPTTVYRKDCPKGIIVSIEDAERLIKKEGWKDSPAKIYEDCTEEMPLDYCKTKEPVKEEVEEKPVPSSKPKPSKKKAKK